MRNAGLEEAQAGIKIARRNINNLRYADDTTLMAESEKELKSLLMTVKVGRGKRPDCPLCCGSTSVCFCQNLTDDTLEIYVLCCMSITSR